VIGAEDIAGAVDQIEMILRHAPCLAGSARALKPYRVK
jgi:hypothetical protein